MIPFLSGCMAPPLDCSTVQDVVSIKDVSLTLFHDNLTIGLDYNDWLRHGFDPADASSMTAWRQCAFKDESSFAAFHVFLTQQKLELGHSYVDDMWFNFNGLPMKWDPVAPQVDASGMHCLVQHWEAGLPANTGDCIPPDRWDLPDATAATLWDNHY